MPDVGAGHLTTAQRTALASVGIDFDPTTREGFAQLCQLPDEELERGVAALAELDAGADQS